VPYAPDPISKKKKRKIRQISPSSFLSFCLDCSSERSVRAKAIRKTLTKPSAASIETIGKIAAALPIQ
jgi:hypothetical protein